MGEADISSLARLLSAAFAPPSGYNALQSALIQRETESGLRERLGKSVLLIAQRGDAGIVGCVEVFTRHFLEGKEIRFWNASVPLENYVTALAVAPAWRRSGVAQALMQTVEDRAWEAGDQTVSLQVDATNEAAVAFYRKMGYEVISRDNALTTPSRYPILTSLVFGGARQRSLLVMQKAKPAPPEAPPLSELDPSTPLARIAKRFRRAVSRAIFRGKRSSS